MKSSSDGVDADARLAITHGAVIRILHGHPFLPNVGDSGVHGVWVASVDGPGNGMDARGLLRAAVRATPNDISRAPLSTISGSVLREVRAHPEQTARQRSSAVLEWNQHRNAARSPSLPNISVPPSSAVHAAR